MAQIGRAVLIRGRAHRDELEQAVLARRGLGVGGEFKPPGIAVALDQRVEPRLIDRHLAAVEPLDARRIDIDADHVITGIGQARPVTSPT